MIMLASCGPIAYLKRRAVASFNVREGWRRTGREVRWIIALMAAGICVLHPPDVLMGGLFWRMLFLAVLLACVAAPRRPTFWHRTIYVSFAVLTALISMLAVVASSSVDLSRSAALKGAEQAGADVAAVVKYAMHDGGKSSYPVTFTDTDIRTSVAGIDIEIAISSMARESCSLLKPFLPTQVLYGPPGNSTLVTRVAMLSEVMIAGRDVRRADYAQACGSFRDPVLPDSAVVVRYRVMADRDSPRLQDLGGDAAGFSSRCERPDALHFRQTASQQGMLARTRVSYTMSTD